MDSGLSEGIIDDSLLVLLCYRKLSAENRKLSSTVEREKSEKKRLSMENEELQWKMRQSTDNLCVSLHEGRNIDHSRRIIQGVQHIDP